MDDNLDAITLANLPCLSSATQALSRLNEAVKNLKMHRNQCKRLCDGWAKLVLASCSSNQNIIWTDYALAMSEMEQNINRSWIKVYTWSTWGTAKSVLYQSQIRHGLDECTKDLVHCTERIRGCTCPSGQSLQKLGEEASRITGPDQSVGLQGQDVPVGMDDSLVQNPTSERKVFERNNSFRDWGIQPSPDHDMNVSPVSSREDAGNANQPDYEDVFDPYSNLCLDGRVTIPGRHVVAVGGYADVWQGSLEGQPVAVKVMRPFASTGRRMQQSKLLRRLWREYLAWFSLSHPNVIKCLGFSYDFCPESYIFPSLVSPWMNNGTVLLYLENYPDADRLALLIGVAEGLSYLHSRRPAIIHGDIRAGNVLVSDSGVPCLCDFGLSRILNEARGMTTSTDVAGSLRWMSPELLHEDSAASVDSDVWAYGMTMLEILSGDRPYSNVKSDIVVLGQIINGQIPSRPKEPRVLRVLPDEVWDICQGCWSIPASERPPMCLVSSKLCGNQTPDREEAPSFYHPSLLPYLPDKKVPW